MKTQKQEVNIQDGKKPKFSESRCQVNKQKLR